MYLVVGLSSVVRNYSSRFHNGSINTLNMIVGHVHLSFTYQGSHIYTKPYYDMCQLQFRCLRVYVGNKYISTLYTTDLELLSLKIEKVKNNGQEYMPPSFLPFFPF